VLESSPVVEIKKEPPSPATPNLDETLDFGSTPKAPEIFGE